MPAQLQQYQIALYNFARHDHHDEATKEKTAAEQKRLSVGTQANRSAAVRKFFSWLLSEQQIAYTPASTLQLPKPPQRLPRGVLTKSEARRLIEATPAVKPRETGESAYFDYIATGDYNNIGTTQLNGVNQERIDRHASITIETNASQEQAILEGIKSAQESSPDYSVNPTKALTHTESTCASNVIKLLSLGGINVGPSLMPQSPKAIWQSAFKQYGDFAGNQGYLPPPNPLFPHSAPVTLAARLVSWIKTPGTTTR